MFHHMTCACHKKVHFSLSLVCFPMSLAHDILIFVVEILNLWSLNIIIGTLHSTYIIYKFGMEVVLLAIQKNIISTG